MRKKDCLTPADVEIIRSMARNGLNQSAVSRELCYVHQSVAYHIARIYDITNLDARDFYDMGKLLKLIGEVEPNAVN